MGSGARAHGADIPVVVTVDLEPDGPGHLVSSRSTWNGIEATRRWVDQIRARIEGASGRTFRVSWLVRCDPQVEEIFGSPSHLIDVAPDLYAEAAERGDAIGLHIHGWRRVEGEGWVDDYGDDAWFEECIDRSFAAYADAFGRPCRIVSFGNRFMGPAAIARLAHHGVAVDVTGEPGNGPVADGDWPHVRGLIPDYRRMPRRPHPLAPGVIELPMTAGRKRKGLRPKAHLSRMRRHGLRERLDHPVQLGGRDLPGVAFGEVMADSLRHQDRPYLSFAVRSDGILDPVQHPRLVGHLDELLALPEAGRFAFLTPTEALSALGAA